MITSKYSLDANSGFTGGIMEVKVSMGGYIDQPNNKKVRSFLEQNEAIENKNVLFSLRSGVHPEVTGRAPSGGSLC